MYVYINIHTYSLYLFIIMQLIFHCFQTWFILRPVWNFMGYKNHIMNFIKHHVQPVII